MGDLLLDAPLGLRTGQLVRDRHGNIRHDSSLLPGVGPRAVGHPLPNPPLLLIDRSAATGPQGQPVNTLARQTANRRRPALLLATPPFPILCCTEDQSLFPKSPLTPTLLPSGARGFRNRKSAAQQDRGA